MVLRQKADKVLVEGKSHPAVLHQILFRFCDCSKLKVEFGGCSDAEEANLLTSVRAVRSCTDERVPLASHYTQDVECVASLWVAIIIKFCLDDDEREISEIESRKNQVRIEEAPFRKLCAFRYFPVLHHQHIFIIRRL